MPGLPRRPRTPAAAALALPAAVRRADRRPGGRRDAALRAVLRRQVHDVAMHATVTDGGGWTDLAPLADAVRAHVPPGAEDALEPRQAVFVRLLRAGALEPAWLLANDNASGVVRDTRSVSTWAGGSTLTTRLPLPVLVEHPESGPVVFAWLPGFRDPRYAVPDDVYDISARCVPEGVLDQAVLRDGALHLYGSASLALLPTGPDDRIVVHLTGPAGAPPIAAAAARGRRPAPRRATGSELARSAWAGWSATIDPARLAACPGTWRAELEIVVDGVSRREPLGRRRGPLAARDVVAHSRPVAGTVVRIGDESPSAGLTLHVGPDERADRGLPTTRMAVRRAAHEAVADARSRARRLAPTGRRVARAAARRARARVLSALR